MLKKLINSYLVVTQKKIKMDAVLNEARRVLKLETNYLIEQQSLKRYQHNFSGSDYKIPKVFESKLVQTDPNPAIFLITENADLVLLDFGATLEFGSQFVKQYQNLVRKVFEGDCQKILKQIEEVCFLGHRESDEVKRVFVDFLIMSLNPFDPQRQPFDFGDSEYSAQIRKQALRFSRMLQYSAPPKDLLFLHRKLGGIFLMLKKMQIKVDLSEFRDTTLNRDFLR